VSEKNYQLVMQKGPKPGQVFDLIGSTMTLGRDELADIIIVDPEVSRQHLQLRETETGYQLKDLGSTNGTFVNGRRLTDEPVDLEPGQELGLGSSIVLRYQEATDAFIPPTLPDADEEAEAPLLLDLPDEPEEEPAPLTVELEDQTEPDEADDDDWTVTEPTFEDIEAIDIETIFGETADSEPDATEIAAPEPETAERPPEPPAPVIPPARAVPTPASAQPADRPAPTKRDGPLVPPGSGSGRRSKRNRILLITTIFLLLCCCAFLVFMYYVGGDLLLEYRGWI
jgi:pSer/pThr/pTyr-binding forkhead associated (FHA) protein